MIPHIATLLSPDLDEVLAHAEVLVVGRADPEFVSLPGRLRPDQLVVDLVRHAQESRSRTQGLADRAARWLTIIALSAGALTLVVWLLLGKGLAFALERMVTVMVTTCPHALGLAIPLVVSVSTALLAGNGLLLIQQYMLIIVIAFGLFDMWVDFRKRLRGAKENSPV